MRRARCSLVLVAVTAASLAGCRAIWGFEDTELLSDASPPDDGSAPRDGSKSHDGGAPPDARTPPDGKSPVDSMGGHPPEAGIPDTGVHTGCDPASVTGKLVFITDMATQGSLGNLAGADKVCQEIAETAGIDGSVRTFRAWLSDETDGGSVAARFTPSNKSYKLANGHVIANSWSDLTTNPSAPYAPINLTLGCKTPGSLSPAVCTTNVHPVWTNTTQSGELLLTSADCSDWATTGSGDVGVVGNADDNGSIDSPFWTADCNQSCNEEAYYYCFEQ
jgi:hypothetical protein